MEIEPLEYGLPFGAGRIRFQASVLTHLVKHQQRRLLCKEAGGQLFARFEEDLINVVDVTGPRSTDFRRRTEYIPDRAAEKVEIHDRYKQGLHFVGDWHTHPERIPVASPRDLNSVDELVMRSKHGLVGFVLVVVGTASLPKGLWLSFHGISRWKKIEAP